MWVKREEYNVYFHWNFPASTSGLRAPFIVPPKQASRLNPTHFSAIPATMPASKTCLFLFFLLFALTSFSHATGAAPRPNILYIYVDDMGWGAIGPNGQAARRARNLPHLITPNLDQLAAEGINFTRAYGCTVCSPARSSQQSGFHQGHTFGDRNDPDNAKKAMRADDILMGDALSAAGYTTGYWGKWGYGGSASQPNPEIVNIQTLPTSHGYEYVVAELHHVRAHTFFQPTLWCAPAKAHTPGGLELRPNTMARWQDKTNYPETPAWQNHPHYPATAYCDDVYAFSALDFVRNQAKTYRASGKPFFGLLALQVPHAPYDEIAQLPDWDQACRKQPGFKQLSDQAKQWAAMLNRIDGHIGNLLEALEDPNGDGDRSDSVAENTLVIFQSDNGGPGNKARSEFDSNGGLRGNKGQIYEGGIRVPTLVRWPLKISAASKLKPGTNSDQIIDVSDWLPTFCDLAEVDAPLGLDGVSIAPTLRGEGHQRQREFIIHEAGKNASIIRGRYKLVLSTAKKTAKQLFDLEQDATESKDIAKAHPQRVKELLALLRGERVEEPKGFANTYHHWIGKDGATASKAINWSDYVYANDGITYLSDNGAPRLSWTASMRNQGSGDSTAVAEQDLSFLGLEVGGGAATGRQVLHVKTSAKVTGRNEIRVASRGKIQLEGGRLHSLRWLDIRPGGKLSGHGAIDATVYSAGDWTVDETGCRVTGEVHLQTGSTLNLELRAFEKPMLQVEGVAWLSGVLQVKLPKGLKPLNTGDQLTLISAEWFAGKFSELKVETPNGKDVQFRIRYQPEGVVLEVQ